jgi:hypothetical protein
VLVLMRVVLRQSAATRKRNHDEPPAHTSIIPQPENSRRTAVTPLT